MDGRFQTVTVDRIVELVAQGKTEEEILSEYRELETEDIRAALRYYDSTRKRLRLASLAKLLGVVIATAAVVVVGLLIGSTPLMVFGAVLAVIAVAGAFLGVAGELREHRRRMQQEPVRPSRIGGARARPKNRSVPS